MSRKTIMPNIAYDSQRRTFYVTLRGKDPATGAPTRTQRSYRTLEEAVQALGDHMAGRALAAGKPTRDLTVGQWLDYWMDQIVRPSRSASTIHGYHMIVRNHLIPGLGSIRLRSLTAAQLQQYLNRKVSEGLCGNTVRKHYGVMHSALAQACQEKLLNENVADHVSRPVTSRPTHHYYDSDTMKQLFQAVAGTTMEPVVKLAGYLGLRRSEICGLKWSSVDRQAKTITISEARTAVNGKAVDKDTKNRSSVRRLGYAGITDLEEVIEGLWQQRCRDMERMGPFYDDRDFVLCHSGGQPYQPDYLSNRLQRVLAGKGLPYVTLHGLRHSFASIAHSCNVPLYGISRALGHSNTATTTQIYMHLFDETHLAVVQEVGRALEEGEAPGAAKKRE